MTLEFLFYLDFITYYKGGFEQHRPAEQSGGEKSPCGAFLDARLAISMKNAQTKTTVRVDGGSVIEKKQASP